MASSQRPSISRHFAKKRKDGLHRPAFARANGRAVHRAAALACGFWTLTACSGPGSFDTSTSRGNKAAGRQDQSLSIERAQIPADETDERAQNSRSQTAQDDAAEDLPDGALRGERPYMLPEGPDGPTPTDGAPLIIESQPPQNVAGAYLHAFECLTASRSAQGAAPGTKQILCIGKTEGGTSLISEEFDLTVDLRTQVMLDAGIQPQLFRQQSLVEGVATVRTPRYLFVYGVIPERTGTMELTASSGGQGTTVKTVFNPATDTLKASDIPAPVAAAWDAYQLTEVPHPDATPVVTTLIEPPLSRTCSNPATIALPALTFSPQSTTCPVFGSTTPIDGRYERTNVTSRAVTLPPNEEICGIQISAQMQAFEAQDVFYLTLEERVIATSKMETAYLSKILSNPSEPVYRYAFTDLKGKDATSGISTPAPYCYNAPGCDLPAPLVPEAIDFQSSIQKEAFPDFFNSPLPPSTFNIKLHLLGDDDSLDCSHSGLEVLVHLQVAR